MKLKFIKFYMSVAESTAKLSFAEKLKVGSVIVKNDSIISYGYNGTPRGWDNICEEILPDGTLKTKQQVLHSESNALMKVTRSAESTDGAVMFCTHAPCIDCAKLIYQSGILKLYYRNEYRSTDGIEFLKNGGIDIEKV